MSYTHEYEHLDSAAVTRPDTTGGDDMYDEARYIERLEAFESQLKDNPESIFPSLPHPEEKPYGNSIDDAEQVLIRAVETAKTVLRLTGANDPRLSRLTIYGEGALNTLHEKSLAAQHRETPSDLLEALQTWAHETAADITRAATASSAKPTITDRIKTIFKR